MDYPYKPHYRIIYPDVIPVGPGDPEWLPFLCSLNMSTYNIGGGYPSFLPSYVHLALITP